MEATGYRPKRVGDVMTWNEDQERLIAAAELGDATPQIAADLLVAARKRAFEAEHKAQQLQTELAAVKASHAWIKTSERAPELHDTVLGLNRHGEVEVFVYCGTYWNPTDGHPDATAVKYSPFWMPLPEPPK